MIGERAHEKSSEVGANHAAVSDICVALPVYGSRSFWRLIETLDADCPMPLEALVRYTRVAMASGDDDGRNRIIESIFRRIHRSNEYWAQNVLGSYHLPADERDALKGDLYADLCERVIRAMQDPARAFWEENFWHCLSFERKHAYHAFLLREGLSKSSRAQTSERIPRSVISRLDDAGVDGDGEVMGSAIEDEEAQKALLAVDDEDVLRLIIQLPEPLKTVILLMFWEGRTQKDTARILRITDRTVRNRLRQALGLLASTLRPERRREDG